MPEWSQFTLLDWVIVVVLLVSTLLSLWRGFVREALSLAGWVAAFLVAGGVDDLHTRQQAHLYRHAGNREGAGDDGLRGDDGGGGGQPDHRDQCPVGREVEEGAGDGFRLGEQQRALAEVVENQRRHDETEPGEADRRPAEVAHVGI